MNGECRTTGKARFATARAAHEAIRQVFWGRRTQVQPRRVYFCKHCQGYHLSSKGDLWERRDRLKQLNKRREDGEYADPKREFRSNTEPEIDRE